MANPVHVDLARAGRQNLANWRGEHPGEILDLSGGDLRGVDLAGSDLARVRLIGAQLEGANLCEANLEGCDLSGADLVAVRAVAARLKGARLDDVRAIGAVFEGADLSEARARHANLECADLSRARLNRAVVDRATLADASLRCSDLTEALLRETLLRAANLADALLGRTAFIDIDLASSSGLDRTRHLGPSAVTLETLRRSGGHIPELFLRGCGLRQDEIQQAASYNPALPAHRRVGTIATSSLNAQTRPPLFLRHANGDLELARRLAASLGAADIRSWLCCRQADAPHALGYEKATFILIATAQSDTEAWLSEEIERACDPSAKASDDIRRLVLAADPATLGAMRDRIAPEHLIDVTAWDRPDRLRQATRRLIQSI